MKTSIFVRTMGTLLAGLAMVAGCDEGSATGTGGSGGGTGGDDMPTTGGTGGTSTTTAGGSSTGGAPAGLSMIDDMEDGDGSILASEGRKGAWYTYNDETATAMQEPAVGLPFEMAPNNPPRDGSAFSANTKGSGFMTWGSGYGFDFNNAGAGTTKAAYDASMYAGITFYARIGAGSTGAVRFNVGDGNTTPEGGVCAVGKCSDDFGKDINLTEAWQRFDIKFADMTQVGWSMVLLPALDAKTLYSVHFQTGIDKSFDLWVDDVAFFE
jgi:hypothetical protein